MLIWIWPRDDETGLLDGEYRDGDILQTQLDAFEPSIGGVEKKTKLIVKIPDPPNMEKVRTELVKPEYKVGATPEAEHEVRHKCIFRLDWRTKFTEPEIVIIEDELQMLPDGATSAGGIVTSGVVSNLFTIADFRRK